jgi:hypothetical protein
MLIQITRRFLLIGAGLLASPGALRAQTRNVIDMLAGDGRFNRWVEVVGRGGATDQFRGAGPMTVFAPVDAAFQGTGWQRIEELLSQGSSGGGGGGTLGGGSPDTSRLRSFIGYHVIAGRALAPAELKGEMLLPTVAGGNLLVAARNGAIAVSNPQPNSQNTFGVGGVNVAPAAAVVGPAIVANNGIIYPIDGLLLP